MLRPREVTPKRRYTHGRRGKRKQRLPSQPRRREAPRRSLSQNGSSRGFRPPLERSELRPLTHTCRTFRRGVGGVSRETSGLWCRPPDGTGTLGRPLQLRERRSRRRIGGTTHIFFRSLGLHTEQVVLATRGPHHEPACRTSLEVSTV